MSKLVFLENGRAVTDSLTVAEKFGKDHDHVIRDIRQQISKLNEANECEWGVSNFGETQYQHPQNKQWYPKFDLTEEAFAIVAMSYVTPAAMKMKVRFLEEFKRMRQQIQSGIDLTGLSPQLQFMIQMEQNLKQIERRQQETEQQLSTIKETFLQRDENWRQKITGLLNGAATRLGGHREVRTESYRLLEERGRCNLNLRLANLKERLAESGATKTKINDANRLDVIEADPRLKEIYTTIVKELSIGTLA
ncbi:Rha family transcriptional regulator [Paenibacillus sp. SN-8-1]|uniref:Rha family transcriptional regulator n=1 Tax=Paenibacillus sp. SN-8-1 TaxID=3435409 RepID=UPI003D9A6276